MPAKVKTSTVRTFTRIRPRSYARRAPIARRADRLPQLMGLAVHADTVLDQLSVTIVGTGSVGATTALSLAPLGLKEIRVVDYGLVKPTSPVTQPFTPAEIGQPKATTIAQRCKQLSPRTQVLAFDGRAQDLPMADLTATSAIVMAGDNAMLERDIGQICLNLGLPLIQGSVHGNSLTAQCRAFGTNNPDAPCPLCLFGEQEFKMLDEEHRWSCEGAQSATSNATPLKNTTPTMSVRSLCALAGEMAALTVLRLALKLGQPVENTLTEINAYTWRSWVTKIQRNPSCPCRHRGFKVRSATRPLADCSLRELLRNTRPPKSQVGTQHTVRVEGFHWVEQGMCACGQAKVINRFSPLQGPVRVRCATCGNPIHAQPFFSRETLPVQALAKHLDRPLRNLGANGCRGVIVHTGNDTLLLTNPATTTTRTHP